MRSPLEGVCQRMLQYLLTVSCQWDYDAAVSEALEQCLANEQSLWFSWDWGRLKQGKISNYEADPRNGIVRNLENILNTS